MNLDSKDIEAVAKDRVRRAESKKLNYYIYGMVGAFIIGIFCLRIETYGTWIGWGVIIVGVLVLLRYLHTVSKKQQVAASHLKREWRAEMQVRGSGHREAEG